MAVFPITGLSIITAFYDVSQIVPNLLHVLIAFGIHILPVTRLINSEDCLVYTKRKAKIYLPFRIKNKVFVM